MMRRQGMPGFLMVWAGQMISTLGSSMVSFALGIWIYEGTDSVSFLALNMLAWLVPGILLAPVAGVYADRMDRRTLMIIGDAGAGLSSLFILVVLMIGPLKLWQIYIATLVNAACSTFQWPAYAAAIPQKHLGRANGLVQAEEMVAYIAAPAVAGLLLGIKGIELSSIILIDILTFGVALLTLLIVHIPSPEPTADGTASQGFWIEIKEGTAYIVVSQGLLGLLIFYMLLEFLQEFTYPLIQPLLLEITTPQIMGTSLSLMSGGLALGVAILGLWGGPKRRIRWIILLTLVGGLAMIVAGLRPHLALITVCGFIYFTLAPLVEGLDLTFWQTRVPSHLQGRVFALVGAATSAVRPLALLMVGPLADGFFTPSLLEGGVLSTTLVGHLFGVGPGRGLALFISALGGVIVLLSALVFVYRPVRNLDAQVH